MTRYVIDAPTLLRVVAGNLKVSSDHQLVAPNWIRSEALSILLDAVRDGTMDEAVALQRHERFTELRVRLLGDRVSRRTAWKIAREQGWASLHEAEYIAITRLQADALISGDETLAAKAAKLVTVASLDDLSTP